jgi:hypothetical protein
MSKSKDLDKTIELIKKIKNSHYRNFDTFEKISQVYPFTNELMKQYNDIIDLNDKKVLTVTGSGDQVITSMIRGAKEIDTFDCNKLTYYHLFLKIAAIQSLEFEEFLDFYTFGKEERPKKRKKEHYKKIREYLTKENVIEYWNNFFKNPNDYFSYFFLGACGTPASKEHSIEYLTEEGFQIAKDKVNDNVSFKNADVNILPYIYGDKKYDFINLSNIFNYISNQEAFSKIIESLLNNNTTEDGIILAGYVWNSILEEKLLNYLINNNCSPEIVKIEAIYNPLKFLKKMESFKINKNTHNKQEDLLILCKKKNK